MKIYMSLPAATWPKNDNGWSVSPGVPWLPEGATIHVGDKISATHPVKLTGSFIVLGDYLTLDYNAIIGGYAHIGDHVSAGNHLTVGTGAIIGDNVTMGDRVTICRNAIIGRSVIIHDGAIIEEGHIVPANSVVTGHLVSKSVRDDIKQLIDDNLETWITTANEHGFMDLTVATNEAGDTWDYQTGDNGYMGSAYDLPFWAVVNIQPDTVDQPLFEDILNQLDELIDTQGAS